MKSDILKKLIKESVREVFQEELKNILLEAIRTPKERIVETIHPSTPQLSSQPPIDYKQNLRKLVGGDFSEISFNSSHAQPAYVPPAINTVGEGSSLPPGEVSLDQIMNLVNK
jgi:hypothetical protein